ncbi:anti-sigma factor family protein [Microbacterium halophytorum]|uniref:anti-sigma factor family protein n=1 Tax=Microbacterium halophytorum TaxID=2067568 RepID=UPI000CFDCC5D|nr:zf-HC2 domain-containing protein [Microbacterium halophytorum]
MNAADDHTRFAEWDAAYVLGALPPADRAAYEEHLSRCGACRSAIAELSPLPGLLSRVPSDRALRMIGGDAAAAPGSDAAPARRARDPRTDPAPGHPGARTPAAPGHPGIRTPAATGHPDAHTTGAPDHPDTPTPAARNDPDVDTADGGPRAELIDIGVARARRRRVARWGAGALAAAAAVAAIVALPMWLTPPGAPGPERESITLAADADVPIEASVELTEVAWGTRIEMDCRYDGAGAPGGAAYALVVVGADGTARELSSWRAYGGATAELSAGTALDLDEIASIEIRFPGGDAPLLSGTVPAG